MFHVNLPWCILWVVLVGLTRTNKINITTYLFIPWCSTYKKHKMFAIGKTHVHIGASNIGWRQMHQSIGSLSHNFQALYIYIYPSWVARLLNHRQHYVGNRQSFIALPKTNIVPEKGPKPKKDRLPTTNFQLYVSFREGICPTNVESAVCVEVWKSSKSLGVSRLYGPR